VPSSLRSRWRRVSPLSPRRRIPHRHKHDATLRRQARTSENSVTAKFAECLLPRNPVPGRWLNILPAARGPRTSSLAEVEYPRAALGKGESDYDAGVVIRHTPTKMPISRARHNGGPGPPIGVPAVPRGRRSRGRYLPPLPFVQLWRHAPSKNITALLLSTQRVLVCY
jgi:hypothetical protein